MWDTKKTFRWKIICLNEVYKISSRHFSTECILRFRTLWCTFTRFNRLFWPITWFWSIVVDLCFIHRYKSPQKLFRTAVKIGHSLLRSGRTNPFLVDCEQQRHPFCTELSHAQMCMQNIDHTLSWDGYDLSYLPQFHFRVIQNNIMDFINHF